MGMSSAGPGRALENTPPGHAEASGEQAGWTRRASGGPARFWRSPGAHAEQRAPGPLRAKSQRPSSPHDAQAPGSPLPPRLRTPRTLVLRLPLPEEPTLEPTQPSGGAEPAGEQARARTAPGVPSSSATGSPGVSRCGDETPERGGDASSRVMAGLVHTCTDRADSEVRAQGWLGGTSFPGSSPRAPLPHPSRTGGLGETPGHSETQLWAGRW